MPRSAAPALAVSHGLLRALIALNILAALFILALLIASFAAEGFVVEGLGLRPDPGGASPVLGMRLVMGIGLVSVVPAQILFSRLQAIVGTVRSGDAFIARNADRLRACAWAVLALEVTHLLVGAVVAASPFHLGWDFSPAGLLAVLLLFVLAQVFAQGVRMRDDLEGTV